MMPAALRWTTDPPLVSGYYWFRGIDIYKDRPVMARVNFAPAADGRRCFIRFFGENFDYVNSVPLGRWAGPIAPPEE